MNRTLNAPKEKSPFWRYVTISYVVFLVAYIAYVIFEGNNNLYPNFSEDALTALGAAFCLFSLPWWIVSFAIWAFKEKKHWGFKAAGVVLGIASLVAGMTMGSMLLALNLSSVTENPANYLRFDEGAALTEKAEPLFPKAIPEGAENVRYYYSYCRVQKSFFLARCEWTLPEASYAAERARIQTLTAGLERLSPEELGENEENTVAFEIDNTTVVSYNDETRSVRYLCVAE